MIVSFELLNPLDSKKTAYFKVLGNTEIYEVMIKLEEKTAIFETSSCCCKWGSFFGQTKENIKNGKICKHLSECLDFLEKNGYINEKINKNIQNGK